MAEFENPFADPEAQNLFHVSSAIASTKSFLFCGAVTKCCFCSVVTIALC